MLPPHPALLFFFYSTTPTLCAYPRVIATTVWLSSIHPLQQVSCAPLASMHLHAVHPGGQQLLPSTAAKVTNGFNLLCPLPASPTRQHLDVCLLAHCPTTTSLQVRCQTTLCLPLATCRASCSFQSASHCLREPGKTRVPRCTPTTGAASWGVLHGSCARTIEAVCSLGILLHFFTLLYLLSLAATARCVPCAHGLRLCRMPFAAGGPHACIQGGRVLFLLCANPTRSVLFAAHPGQHASFQVRLLPLF
jgi:hypothetical protein